MSHTSDRILAEMALHVPLCTLEDPGATLIIGCPDRALFEAVIAQHDEAPKAIFAERFTPTEGDRYDLIIDFKYLLRHADEKRALYGSLSDRGIVVVPFGTDALEAVLADLPDTVRYAMPYGLSTLMPASVDGFLFASRRLHPTADLRIHKADMIEESEYYSVDIHEAAFALPASLYRTLKSHLKI